VNEKTWMKEWNQIARRFRLYQFQHLSRDEANSFQWDTEMVHEIILDTVQQVQKHLPFDKINITIFPALPFPWYQRFDQSLWTNGYTNGVNNIQIAVPPNPNEDFLRYMIAHELHHATPINPIYKLTFETFSLIDWFKMEGGAEYFSLSLYEDKRWWKEDFSPETEWKYWRMVKDKLGVTDDKEKSPLCFGDPTKGIPLMAGYAFAYRLSLNYTEKHPTLTIKDLLSIEPTSFIDEYSFQ
jgi:uncharacterized protein YjaZ